MITKISIKNFKKLKNINFELGNEVVLVGPNNSGKTSILQALTLWEIGMRKWNENGRNKTASQRKAVPINRLDLFSLPISDAKLMWFEKHVRKGAKDRKNTNIKIEIIVEGVEKGKIWHSGLEFDFNGSEAFYCRPLKKTDGSEYEISEEAYNAKVAYLQPMSGLASQEDKFTYGSIDVRVGQGKTADVLRNICYQMLYPEVAVGTASEEQAEKNWILLTEHLEKKFGAKLNKPMFIAERGVIEMTYSEKLSNYKIEYDLSSAGRGFHQTLLLLAYLYSYPNRVILLDEPDAHLEIIRQREIFSLLMEVAREQNSQLIIASHSEVILNEAAEIASVVGIFGNETQNLKSVKAIKQFEKTLKNIGWDKYYLAREKGHILYLEGETDLVILKEFAKLLNHKVLPILENANIHFLSNNIPSDAENNFFGLSQVLKELKGIALFDRLEKEVTNPHLKIICWQKREIENYFGFPEVLENFASNENNLAFMKAAIENNTLPRALKNKNDSWWKDEKISDNFLTPVFEEFYKTLKIYNQLPKGKFYELVKFLKPEKVEKEVIEKLDLIYEYLT
ncbi:MAG: AAA family ATPase [Calditrichaeota bacterium]|nr:MAG: AAA family ATPase [Calditrichota bacterium]